MPVNRTKEIEEVNAGRDREFEADLAEAEREWPSYSFSAAQDVWTGIKNFNPRKRRFGEDKETKMEAFKKMVTEYESYYLTSSVVSRIVFYKVVEDMQEKIMEL